MLNIHTHVSVYVGTEGEGGGGKGRGRGGGRERLQHKELLLQKFILELMTFHLRNRAIEVD